MNVDVVVIAVVLVHQSHCLQGMKSQNAYDALMPICMHVQELALYGT
jgi:hypothetical protein